MAGVTVTVDPANTWLYRNQIENAVGVPRVAVKNNIDLAGVPTSNGNRWLALRSAAAPPVRDAACVELLRAGGYHVAGATNLHELCHGGSGVNPWFGTPVNPLDPTRVPGGSSSGSAVAVATGQVEVALGSDTAGSVRTPAAFCGVVGLKPASGLFPTRGVWPLAPSLDVAGLLGARAGAIDGALAAMDLGLDAVDPAAPHPRLLRVELPDIDPVIDTAIGRALVALAANGVTIEGTREVPGWSAVAGAADDVFFAEANRLWQWLLAEHPDELGLDVTERLTDGLSVDLEAERRGRSQMGEWRDELIGLCGTDRFLVLPTRAVFAPTISSVIAPRAAPGPPVMTIPVNAAGCAAIAVPVPALGAPVGAGGQALPASLQIVGPPGSERRLLALAGLVESVVPLGDAH